MRFGRVTVETKLALVIDHTAGLQDSGQIRGCVSGDVYSSVVTTSSYANDSARAVVNAPAVTTALEHYPGHWRHSVPGVSGSPSVQSSLEHHPGHWRHSVPGVSGGPSAVPAALPPVQSSVNSPTSVPPEQRADQVYVRQQDDSNLSFGSYNVSVTDRSGGGGGDSVVRHDVQFSSIYTKGHERYLAKIVPMLQVNHTLQVNTSRTLILYALRFYSLHYYLKLYFEFYILLYLCI